MKFLKTIILLILIIPQLVHSASSMRHCTLLPIKDSLNGAIAFKVFERVELALKESEWCVYKSNSDILNILANYKKNLSAYLENPEVLKIVSEKLKAGSLIQVKLENKIRGMGVELKIIGENGEDIYFKERTDLSTEEVTVIARTIRNWLDVFEKTIPYKARVLGVLGNQFTIDAGSLNGFKPDTEVIVIRPLSKKRHPLLKEIVDWETERIGKGKIFHSSKNQAQGQMVMYDTKKRLKIDDWILMTSANSKNYVEEAKFEEEDEFSFGKLGEISLLFGYSPTTATVNSTSTKKISGGLLGIDLKTTLWMTRKYWAGLDIGRKFGTLDKEEGTLVNSSNSLSQSSFDLKFGFKYLPMGFFYGPQVDVHIGYSSYTYGLDTQVADGFTEFTFKGLTLGAKGIMPIQKIMRVYLELGLMISPGYSEEVTIYGEDDSASHYKLGLGGSYLFSPNMTIDGGYEIVSSKAKFVSPNRSIQLKNSSLKIGTTFTF